MGDLFAEQLQLLRARSLHRKLREIGSAQGSIVDLVGQRLINFSSNDYLGLASDRRLREAAVAAINERARRCFSSGCAAADRQPLGRREKSKLASAIFPWIVGDEQLAMEISRALQAEGFLVPAVRYPTVAKGCARLRITVTASHDEAQIKALSAALARLSAAK
jgi:8-amino-7-oxononanoate synthase